MEGLDFLPKLELIHKLIQKCDFCYQTNKMYFSIFLKLADVRCAGHVCGLIHQVYGDFSEPLKKGLVKIFDGYGGKDEEKVFPRAITTVLY